MNFVTADEGDTKRTAYHTTLARASAQSSSSRALSPSPPSSSTSHPSGDGCGWARAGGTASVVVSRSLPLLTLLLSPPSPSLPSVLAPSPFPPPPLVPPSSPSLAPPPAAPSPPRSREAISTREAPTPSRRRENPPMLLPLLRLHPRRQSVPCSRARAQTRRSSRRPSCSSCRASAAGATRCPPAARRCAASIPKSRFGA